MVTIQDTKMNPKYIIDTSAILSQKDGEPHRRKIYRSQWEKIDELIRTGVIVTCSEIAYEVEDEVIKRWMTETGMIVLSIDDEVQENVKQVVSSNKKLVDFKSNKSSGDAFLIATALKYGLIVITEESQKSDKKIPFTCNQLGIESVNVVGLCEKEKWEF